LDALWKKIKGMKPLLSVLPKTTVINGQKVGVSNILLSYQPNVQTFTDNT
jgi:hypothetical protein